MNKQKPTIGLSKLAFNCEQLAITEPELGQLCMHTQQHINNH